MRRHQQRPASRPAAHPGQVYPFSKGPYSISYPYHPQCAGTNNARLAGLLRNLASYFYKDPHMLFLTRVSQGLLHMSKGLVSISPYHTDRQLMSGGCACVCARACVHVCACLCARVWVCACALARARART